MIADDEILLLDKLLKEVAVEESRSDLLKFTSTTFNKFKPNWFHKKYYKILHLFATKEIKNLIISVPPQHGKSEGSSKRLPAYIAGSRPDEKIALISYSATKAQKFGREIMGIMREPVYEEIFPEVNYPKRGYTGAKSNTNENRESINSVGSMKFVGVSGSLTGDPVDVLLMDDLYKDWKEANSPIIRQNVWDWYTSVAETRLHNDSQQLIVFTRWSEDDLVGRLEDKGKVVELKSLSDIDKVIESLLPDQFLKVNFPAIKEGSPNDLDPREIGESLWEERHSLVKLSSSRDKEPEKFDCLYQGDPSSKEGLLYHEFDTYDRLPSFKIIKNRTDTADTGMDYLCSITYGVPLNSNNNKLYVLDWIYTDKPMEDTEPMTIDLIKRSYCNEVKIESNNGGRGFSRIIKKAVECHVHWFHQSQNKEARIYSQSASVNNRIVFPNNWNQKDPTFYKHITKYKKVFKANEFDDAPDVLTGIIEDETRTKKKLSTKKTLTQLGINY